MGAGIRYPQIQPEKVPERVERDVARVLYRSIREYFDQPGVQEAFERWCTENGRTPGAQPE